MILFILPGAHSTGSFQIDDLSEVEQTTRNEVDVEIFPWREPTEAGRQTQRDRCMGEQIGWNLPQSRAHYQREVECDPGEYLQ